jgi:hypothetical protein
MNEKTQELAIILLRTYILLKQGKISGNIQELAMVCLSVASKVTHFIVKEYS